MNTTLLYLSTFSAALMAGLFYAWSISVMPGLKRVSDANFIAAMQAMNRAILNPAFFIIFLGSIVVLPLTAFMYYSAMPSTQFWYIAFAALLYLSGTIAVTFFGNVPLNNALEAFQLTSATDEEVKKQRAAFEQRWTNLNLVRTLTSIAALLFLLLACLEN